MGARGEDGAVSHWLPTYVHKRERQAGQHCYLKTLIWCLSLQVTLLRCGAGVRAGARGCSPDWNTPASEAAGGGWGSASAAPGHPVRTGPGLGTCRAVRAQGQVCWQQSER